MLPLVRIRIVFCDVFSPLDPLFLWDRILSSTSRGDLGEGVLGFLSQSCGGTCTTFSGVLQSRIVVHYGVRRVENHCQSLHPELVGGEKSFYMIESVLSLLCSVRRDECVVSTICRILSFRLGFLAKHSWNTVDSSISLCTGSSGRILLSVLSRVGIWASLS